MLCRKKRVAGERGKEGKRESEKRADGALLACSNQTITWTRSEGVTEREEREEGEGERERSVLAFFFFFYFSFSLFFFYPFKGGGMRSCMPQVIN